jgi:hypothetical protein
MPSDIQPAASQLEQLEQALVQKIKTGDVELPLLPQAASKVMALASDPNADAAKLRTRSPDCQLAGLYAPQSGRLASARCGHARHYLAVRNRLYRIPENRRLQSTRIRRRCKTSVAPLLGKRSLRQGSCTHEASQRRKCLPLRSLARHRKARRLANCDDPCKSTAHRS